MKEIWKDIPGYEGYYQVSNLGRVRSLDRVVNGRWGNTRFKGRVLKPFTSKNDYPQVDLWRDGRGGSMKVHKLVAMAFLNHKPCGYKEVVDHIDNDKTNNSLDNLQLITNRENTSKDKTGGTSKYVGVYWNKGAQKWQARIWIDGKRKSLGYFDDEYEAHLAYQNELSKIEKKSQ